MAYHQYKHKKRKGTTKNGDRKQIKWRVGDLIQYNSDPDDENDRTDNLDTRQGVIIAYKEDNKQISIQRQDDDQIYNYFINDIAMIYNITKNGHPKPTTGVLLKHHKEIYNEEFADQKSKIKEARANRDRELVKEEKAKLNELKSKVKSERNEIKRQTKALRKNYDPDRDKFEDQHVEEKDCWEYRLPNMQQFIINISNKEYKNKTDKRLRNILNDYKEKQIISSAEALQKIVDWIDDKMPNALAYTTKPKDMSKIISNLSNNIVDILSMILADKPFCEEICDRSYHHDLFEKMVIMTGKKGWKLRLHLFREDNIKEIQEELHSHRNHFLSTCLYGSITQKVWEIMKEKDNGDGNDDNKDKDDEDKDADKDQANDDNDDNKPNENENQNGPDLPEPAPESNANAAAPDVVAEAKDDKDDHETADDEDQKEEAETVVLHKYTYDPKGDAKNREFNIIKHPEMVKLKCVKVQTTNVDDMYYMHPSIIHQVVRCEGKTITLVLNTKTVMLKSCFGSEQKWHSQQFKRQKFKYDELNDILSTAVKLIKSIQ